MYLILFSLLTSFSLAGTKPECSANHVLNNCNVFKQNHDKPYIQVTEGTFISNPLHQQSGSQSESSHSEPLTSYGGAINPEAQRKMAEDHLILQTEIIENLQSAGLPLRTQLSLSQNLAYVLAFPTQDHDVPWPITDAKATLKFIKGESILSELKSTLGEEKFNRLIQPIQAMQKSYKDQMVQQQRQQAEEIQRQKDLYDKEQVQNLEKRQKRKEEVQKLFEQTKEQVIQVLSRGKSPSQQSEIEKNLIEKVKKIKMLDPDSDEVFNSPSCMLGAENAFYLPDRNVLTLCPTMLNKPNSALVSIIAHELAHSVDTCGFQMPSYEIDLAQLQKFSEGNKFDKATKEFIDQLLKNKTNEVYYDLELIFPNPSHLQDLLKKKIIVQKTQSVSYDKYPFKSELQCLSSNSSIKQNEAEDIQYTLQSIKKSLSKENSAGSEQSLKDYARLLQKYPQCLSSLPKSTHSGEVMSDVFGAIILDKYYEEHPPKSDLEKVAGLFFAPLICKNIEETTTDYIPPSLLSNFLGMLAHGTHPGNESRLEDIQFNFSPLAEKFGCKPKGKSCFDHLSLNRSQSATSKASGGGSSVGERVRGTK